MPVESPSSLRVVARFLDGRVLKGTTRDFSPSKLVFHVHPEGTTGAASRIALAELKSVFFVKSFEGDSRHVETAPPDAQGPGRRIQVTFTDGEVLTGFTVGYAPDRPGFFFVPADPDSNNLRVFVVRTAVARTEFMPAPRAEASGTRSR